VIVNVGSNCELVIRWGLGGPSSGSQPDAGGARLPLPPVRRPRPVLPVFTTAERLTLAGFVAGYTGLIRHTRPPTSAVPGGTMRPLAPMSKPSAWNAGTGSWSAPARTARSSPPRWRRAPRGRSIWPSESDAKAFFVAGQGADPGIP
jgi:hypothetical protein